jgi:putative flippase GtrA
MVDLDYSGRVDARSESEEPTPPGGADPVIVPRGTEGMVGAPGPLLRLIRDQRVAFLLVGAANTAIGFFWFVLFQLTVGAVVGQYGYLATLGCAHVASVLCAFVLYRRFVFRVHGHVLRDLGRFELVYLVALAVNYAALPLLVEFFHITPILAQAVIVVATTTISWFGHRGFSFRRKPGEHPAPAQEAKK